jgi:hypothetical protein
MDAEEEAFVTMKENEISDTERSPFNKNDKEKRPFYRGILIYKNRMKVVYFRLLNLDKVVCRIFIPSEIAMGHDPFAKYEIQDIMNWKEILNYTQEEKSSYQGLPDEIESDKIRYESENARKYGSPPEGEELPSGVSATGQS